MSWHDLAGLMTPCSMWRCEVRLTQEPHAHTQSQPVNRLECLPMSSGNRLANQNCAGPCPNLRFSLHFKQVGRTINCRSKFSSDRVEKVISSHNDSCLVSVQICRNPQHGFAQHRWLQTTVSTVMPARSANHFHLHVQLCGSKYGQSWGSKSPVRFFCII